MMMCTRPSKLSFNHDQPVLKQGMMQKRTGMLRLWKRRYFKLVEDSLNYFVNETDGSDNRPPAGRILLNQIEELEHRDGKTHMHSVHIVEKKGKKHSISFQSNEERSAWMKTIQDLRGATKIANDSDTKANLDKDDNKDSDIKKSPLSTLSADYSEDRATTSNPNTITKSHPGYIENSCQTVPSEPTRFSSSNESLDKYSPSKKCSREEESSVAITESIDKNQRKISIKKDPTHGIGCTIKFVGDALYVSRIVPESPIAKTGVLKPGDEIREVNGLPISKTPLTKIKEVLKDTSDEIVFTVKPVTLYGSNQNPNSSSAHSYTEVDPTLIKATFQHIEMLELETSGSISSENDVTDDNTSDGLLTPQPSAADEKPQYTNAEVKNEKEVEPVSSKATNYVELDFKR